MSNNNFSSLDKVKMTFKHIRTSVSFKITNGKGIFTLILVDLEMKPVFLFENLK